MFLSFIVLKYFKMCLQENNQLPGKNRNSGCAGLHHTTLSLIIFLQQHIPSVILLIKWFSLTHHTFLLLLWSPGPSPHVPICLKMIDNNSQIKIKTFTQFAAITEDRDRNSPWAPDCPFPLSVPPALSHPWQNTNIHHERMRKSLAAYFRTLFVEQLTSL